MRKVYIIIATLIIILVLIFIVVPTIKISTNAHRVKYQDEEIDLKSLGINKNEMKHGVLVIKNSNFFAYQCAWKRLYDMFVINVAKSGILDSIIVTNNAIPNDVGWTGTDRNDSKSKKLLVQPEVEFNTKTLPYIRINSININFIGYKSYRIHRFKNFISVVLQLRKMSGGIPNILFNNKKSCDLSISYINNVLTDQSYDVLIFKDKYGQIYMMFISSLKWDRSLLQQDISLINDSLSKNQNNIRIDYHH
jgi:hypothetical protein